MEKHIEPRVVLQAADKIRQYGEKRDWDYLLDGISLMISLDLEEFYKLIQRIASTDY
jgi:hypothetical protein